MLRIHLPLRKESEVYMDPIVVPRFAGQKLLLTKKERGSIDNGLSQAFKKISDRCKLHQIMKNAHHAVFVCRRLKEKSSHGREGEDATSHREPWKGNECLPNHATNVMSL